LLHKHDYFICAINMEDTVFRLRSGKLPRYRLPFILIVLIKSRIAKWPDGTKGEQKLPAVLPTVDLTCSDYQ
jgi:hypothetical protein